jgi:hypothetical protein
MDRVQVIIDLLAPPMTLEDLLVGMVGSRQPKRPEERSLNTFVLVQTYVLKAMTGGYLAVTWSTVVLLGGFVTALGKYDFWSLTVISLLQAARASFRLKKMNPINSTIFVLFGKYCRIVDQLGSKDSSRDFQLNCVISYFFTYIYYFIHGSCDGERVKKF